MSTLHEAARRVVAAWASKEWNWVMECNAAVLALDAALKAQPEPAQEPVLVVEKEPDYWSRGHFYEGSRSHIDPTKVLGLPIGTKLYTAAQPQRPPLTDEEISDIYIDWDITPGRRIADLVRAIERKVRGEA